MDIISYEFSKLIEFSIGVKIHLSLDDHGYHLAHHWVE